MKYSAAVLALIGATKAGTGYQVHVNIDEDEIERASRAIDRRIYQWGRDNSDTIEPIAMSVKAIVEEYLTRKTSTDNIRAESMITILNAAKTAFYPNPETCDEEAFTTCLVNDESVDILRYGAPDIEDMFELYATDCA